MGFGSAFSSAWNKASDAAKQKVAQVATTAKQVVTQSAAAVKQTVNQAANTAQQTVNKTAQAVKSQAQVANKFIANQTAKATTAVKQATNQAAGAAKQAVNQTVGAAKQAANQAISLAQQQKNTALNAAKTHVAKAVELAKPLVKKANELAKQKLQQAKNTVGKAKQAVNKTQDAGKQKAAWMAKKVKDTFKNVAKKFSNNKYVKKAVELCPVVAPFFPPLMPLLLIKPAQKLVIEPAKQILNSSTSPLSKGASLLSLGINRFTSGKTIYDLIKVGMFTPGMINAGLKAAKFGPDGAMLAMGKNFLRYGKPAAGVTLGAAVKSTAMGVAIDVLLGGTEGALNSFARNVDKKDISTANLVGRVGFGAFKGGAKSLSGPLVGAVIGGAIGSIIPGFGTAVGAMAGAALIGPLLDIPGASLSEWAFNRLLPDKYEENVGEFADQAAKKAGESAAQAKKKISPAVKGAWNGVANLFR